MGIYNRKICLVKHCGRPCRNKGLIKGVKYFGNKCNQCHRNSKFKDRDFGLTLSEIPNPKCERCGWADAPCDRHKKEPLLGYIRENVVILCPNCHRLVTLGLVKL